MKGSLKASLKPQKAKGLLLPKLHGLAAAEIGENRPISFRFQCGGSLLLRG